MRPAWRRTTSTAYRFRSWSSGNHDHLLAQLAASARAALRARLWGEQPDQAKRSGRRHVDADLLLAARKVVMSTPSVLRAQLKGRR